MNTQIELTEAPKGPWVSGASQAPANSNSGDGQYVLATGSAAVRRLMVLHDIYGPVGYRVLLEAGIAEGMRVADFGCGVGAVTRMLAGMVGPSGHVTGIDTHEPQLVQASRICADSGMTNVSFTQADACRTGLPRDWFDMVYCRFLLLHLPDPLSCLREMRSVLKPGGRLVVEDGDLASATSIPRTSMDAFADLFTRMAPIRGVNYSISNDLYHLVKAAGFSDPEIEIHQPAIPRGQSRFLLKWSVEEAGPAFVGAGLLTSDELAETLAGMQTAIEDPDVLILAPRMSLVWARK